MTILGVTQIVFLILKAAGLVEWSWFVVFSPLAVIILLAFFWHLILDNGGKGNP